MHKPVNVFQLLSYKVYQQWMKLITSYINCTQECNQKIMQFHILLTRNKIFPFLYRYQLPCSNVKPKNNGPYSLEVATQASGISKLCLMMFRKIAVSQPDLISNQHLQFLLPLLQQSCTLWLVINHSPCLTLKMSCYNT